MVAIVTKQVTIICLFFQEFSKASLSHILNKQTSLHAQHLVVSFLTFFKISGENLASITEAESSCVSLKNRLKLITRCGNHPFATVTTEDAKSILSDESKLYTVEI